MDPNAYQASIAAKGMDAFAGVTSTQLIDGTGEWLTAAQCSALSTQQLGCLDTAFPHAARTVEGPDDTMDPREDHPVFYGCYDWHSAVHSHWSLVRLLRVCETHPDRTRIIDDIDERLTTDNVETERAYVADNPRFERPYGWAWLLRLVAELELWDSSVADRWHELLGPFADDIVDRIVSAYYPIERPIRVGTHGNTAFALTAFLDYARVVGDEGLAKATEAQARRCFLDDDRAPIQYEPLGWDFLSPALVEADLMRRVLPPDQFQEWAVDFLTEFPTAIEAGAFAPAEPADTSGMALHLVGLNLSRAWCLADIADALTDRTLASSFADAARAHSETGVSGAFTDAYAGSHWLSSFVVYLLTRHRGGIDPPRLHV